MKVFFYFIVVCFLFLGGSAYALDLGFPVLIAHAGGGLNGKKYLNSLEAVQNSIKMGITYIELDLLETTDHDLIAAHDWEHFHNLTGFVGDKYPISVHDAKRRKILKTQNVLTSDKIVDIFTHNPNLVLVTDKIQNIDLIIKKFSPLRDRLIVEVFSIEKYHEAKGKGILYPAFCVDNSNKKYKLAQREGVTMITLLANNLDDHLNWLSNNKNIVAFAFSISNDNKANNIESIKKYMPFIHGWYTDFLSPRDFQ